MLTTNHSTIAQTPQAGAPVTPETKRKPMSQAKRAHELPSQLMPCLRRSIVDSYRAGRSVKQTATEYCVTQALVLELVDRAERQAVRVWLEALADDVRALKGGLPTPPRLRLAA